jgi:hypothetical protein
MVATATDKLVDNFTYSNPSPIVDQPTNKTLVQLHLKLNSDAASIHSNLGSGQLGLLQLTLYADVYSTLPATPFIRELLNFSFPNSFSGFARMPSC